MEEIVFRPSCVTFLDNQDDWDRGLKRITRCSRIAYRSQNKFDENDNPIEARKNNEKLVGRFLFRNEGDTSPRHTSTTEHVNFGIILYTSRAIANEFVRHRHTAFTQESTRYVNFNKKSVEFILPEHLSNNASYITEYLDSCKDSWKHYAELIKNGFLPQDARDSLPLGLATSMAMSSNIAEWRSIFNLRCDKGAHPEARCVANTILSGFNKYAPWAFSDLYEKFDIGNAQKVVSVFE